MSTHTSKNSGALYAKDWQKKGLAVLLDAAHKRVRFGEYLDLLGAVRLACAALDNFTTTEQRESDPDFQAVSRLLCDAAGAPHVTDGVGHAPLLADETGRTLNLLRQTVGGETVRLSLYSTYPGAGYHLIDLDSADLDFYVEGLRQLQGAAGSRGDKWLEERVGDMLKPPHSRRLPDAVRVPKSEEAAPPAPRNVIEEIMLANAQEEQAGPGGRAGALVGDLRSLLAADASLSETQDALLQIAHWRVASRYLLGLEREDSTVAAILQDVAAAADAPTLGAVRDRLGQIVDAYDAAVRPMKPGKQPKAIPSPEEQREQIVRDMAEEKARRIADEPGGITYYATTKLLDALRHDLKGAEIAARLESLAGDMRRYEEVVGTIEPKAAWLREQIEQATGPDRGNEWQMEQHIRSALVDVLRPDDDDLPYEPSRAWLRVGPSLVRCDLVSSVRLPRHEGDPALVNADGAVFATNDREQIAAITRFIALWGPVVK